MKLTAQEYRDLIASTATRLAARASSAGPRDLLALHLRLSEIMEVAFPLRAIDPDQADLDKIWAEMRDRGEVSYLRPRDWRPPLPDFDLTN